MSGQLACTHCTGWRSVGDRFRNQEDGLRSLAVKNFKCQVASSVFDGQTHHRILGAFPNYTSSAFYVEI